MYGLIQEWGVWRVPSIVDPAHPTPQRPLSNIHEHRDGIAVQLAMFSVSQKWLGCAGGKGAGALRSVLVCGVASRTDCMPLWSQWCGLQAR